MESRLLLSTVTVINGADAGNGSLRGALVAAAPGDTIDFAASVREVDLTSAGLTLAQNVTLINDQGAGPVTVNGGGSFTVFTVNSGVTASISGETITNGKSAGFGGGIVNGGTLTLTNDTLSNNTAGVDGGGISNTSTGSLTLTGDTLAGNSAPGGNGGGIVNNGGAVILTNDTFTNNSSDNGGAIFTAGGGIVTLTDDTLSGNSAHYGGGIYNNGSTLTLTDTIVAANSALDADADIDGAADASSSNNLIGDGAGLTGISDGSGGNQIGASAKLAPLGNYGGPTETMPLQTGSAAIGAGAAVNGITTDQRGVPRTATPDIGAYQYSTPATVTIAGGDVNGLITYLSPDTTTTLNLTQSIYDLTQVNNNWYGPDALPPIQSNVTINGNGATLQRDSSCAQTTAGAFRFFYVSGGIPTELPLGTLTLKNLTLTNGLAKGGDSATGGGGMGAGGAIFNQGNLTLNGVTLTGNAAMGGNTRLFESNGRVVGNGGGIGQDGSSAGGGGFGGSFPKGVYGGAGNDIGGGGFDAAGQEVEGGSGDTGGGLSGLGGWEAGQGFGGDGGSNEGESSAIGGDLGFGGPITPVPGPEASFAGGGGGVGGGGAEFGDGGFGGGGGGGGNGVHYPPSTGDIHYEAGGFGGGGGGPGGGDGLHRKGLGGFGAGNSNPIEGEGGGGAGMGGAVFSMYGSVTVVNSTLTANTAQGGSSAGDDRGGPGSGGSGFGGAIFNLDGTASITFSTLAGNTVTAGTGFTNGSADGGALFNLAYGSNYDSGLAVTASATIGDSILSGCIPGTHDLVNQEVDGGYKVNFDEGQPVNTGNTASITTSAPNIVVAYNNLSGGPKGAATLSTTGFVPGVTNANLGLAASLADNGGPTQTLALLPVSPAINAGKTVSGITTDQRGLARPAASPDIGAYQTGADIITGTDYLVPSGTTAASLTTSTTGTPVTGASVVLTGTDVFGVAVHLSTTTNSNGVYTFGSLNPSNGSGYTLTETPPSSSSHLGQTSTTAGAVTTPASTPIVSNLVLATNGKTSTDNFFEVGSAAVKPAKTVIHTADDGGVYNGKPFPATGYVAGPDGKRVATPTFLYYLATDTKRKNPLPGAPSNAGQYFFTATFAGNSNYLPSSTSAPFTIARASTVIHAADHGGVANGKPYPATGYVAGIGGASIATPVFTYYLATDTHHTSPLRGAPSAVGSYYFLANYAGGANYLPSVTSAPFKITKS